ncbi:uncharacterized protein LOC144448547 [Glandiceps talaboti]
MRRSQNGLRMRRKQAFAFQAKVLGSILAVTGLGTIVLGMLSISMCRDVTNSSRSRFILMNGQGILCLLVGAYYYVYRNRTRKSMITLIITLTIIVLGSFTIFIHLMVLYLQIPCHMLDELSLAFVATESITALVALLLFITTC